jgi:RNA-directed DNA polymerase
MFISVVICIYISTMTQGKNLPRIVNFFKTNPIEPNSQKGYKLMKKEFKKFKYQLV